jgi:surfactin synthase thioesterase subunit/aryl carrier-like protein
VPANHDFDIACGNGNGTLISAEPGTAVADKHLDSFQARLCEQVARILRVPVSRIDPRCALNDLGMDSLSAVELRNSMQKAGVTLELRTILNGASIAKLVQVIQDQFDGEREEPHAKARAPRDPWILIPRPNPSAMVRLLCFPYAGGGPAVFGHWADALPDFLEVGIIHLPGRGSRLHEQPLTDMESLVAALTPSVQSWMTDKPCAFLGHSLGALILFEVADALCQADGASSPVHLFVSGARAPDCYHDEQFRHDRMQYSPVPGTAGHDLTDLQLMEMLRDLGFEASRALERDEEIRQLMLPTVRADLRIHDGYRYRSRPPLDVPIIAVGGRVDPFVTAEQLLGWRRHTTGRFTGMFRPGGHYFVEREKIFWAELLSTELAALRQNEPVTACAR